MNLKMNERRPLKVVKVKGEEALILEIDDFFLPLSSGQKR